MADFLPAYERMILNEGGYRLHTVAGDTGGQTYAGISRNNWPQWTGWATIDDGRMPTPDIVRAFYRLNFWDVMSLDSVTSQDVARMLFDFGVNAGDATAAKLAQLTVGATPDGKIGPKSIEAINAVNRDLFVAHYTIAKIAHYNAIALKNKSQRIFLPGWIARALREAK